MAEAVSLRSLRVGDTAKITSVDAPGELNRRIRDMGLTPGSTVKVVGRAPLQDPVALRLSGVTIMLRNKEADYISVVL
ncbi:MAG: FeoA family protein [Desulfovibrionaceae bacterium]|nr:FeoA family protein [Desulfovibrionaceae bacterium]